MEIGADNMLPYLSCKEWLGTNHNIVVSSWQKGIYYYYNDELGNYLSLGYDLRLF